jgi:YidC/Oxa1 family membrane protein insertase
MFNSIIDFSLDAAASLLAFFYSLPVVGGSYGIAIMLLTAAVMIVLMPLTIRATRSTIKMTMLQPELRELQKQYKDDKAQMNQAMMAMYQENGVNPVGGCLPMLAQLPVFLLLFNVLRGLTERVSDKPYYQVSVRARELLGESVTVSNTFDPAHVDPSTELYRDLSNDTEMLFGPFDLSNQAWDVVQSNFLGSFPYLLLIVFVVASSYYQQRQISARRGAQPDNPTPQQQTQQQLLRILPLMSGIWSFFFPAGLVLYWATSNLFRIGQQAYITQALYKGDGPGSEQAQEKVEKDREARAAARSKSKDDSGNGGSDDDSTDGKLIGDGRPGRKNRSNGDGSSPNTGGSAGDKSDKAAVPADRNEAWARRRAQKTKAQTGQKKAATEGSSRTTPKGTKPPSPKKKRKR